MDSIFFLLIFAVIGIVILVGYYFSSKAIIKRKLKKSHSKKIADFKNGDVAKVVGRVEFVDEPHWSPLSKRKCAHYFVHIEEKVSSGKNSKWETLIKEEVSSNFLIKEEKYYAFINDHQLKSYIVQDIKYTSGFWNDAAKHLEEYLKSKGEDSEGFLGMNRTLRYKEGVLEEGEKIAVLGKGEWKEANLLDLPDKYGKVLEIKSKDEEGIYLSDDPDTTLRNLPEIEVKESQVEMKEPQKKEVKKEYRRSRYRK